jgi:DNA-binding beta-propeller fold protein YncE
MPKRAHLLLPAVLAVAVVGAAQAKDIKLIGTIATPQPLTGFDISYVDQQTQRYYLADRGAGSVDIFDAKTDKFIGAVPGFVGNSMKDGKVDFDTSGPAGVLAFDDEAWAGDGNSTLKVIDLKTMKIVDTIATGGKNRFDEFAYDPKDQVIAGGNGDDDPPFITLVSTKPGHKIIAKIVPKNATDGIEQPDYNPADGLFYEAIPEFDKNPKKGGVLVFDATGKTVKTLPVANCHPNGLVFGPNQNFLLGCSANGKEGMAPILVVMNAKTGKVVSTIHGAGGADEVAYSKTNGQYYTGSAGLSAIFVIDAKTNKLVQKIALKGGRAHSVAVNEANGHIYVPNNTDGGACGCIQVYAPAM